MSRQAAHGISMDLPSGWSGKIYRRREGDSAKGSDGVGTAAAPSGAEEVSGGILRAATVPIELDDGDFGGGIVQRLGALDAFFVLFEYQVDENLTPGEGLFASRRVPWPVRPRRYSPETLQVTLPGQVGFQHFFTAAGRPFCLYSVLGSSRRARAGAARVNQVLETILIDPTG